MLVLTTMFVSVSNELPKTSYMKMVDYWLVFNLFIPFVEVLLHVYMVREMIWWCFVRFLKGCDERRKQWRPKSQDKQNRCEIQHQ